MIDKILFLGPLGSYSEIAKNVFKNKFSDSIISTACEDTPLDSIFKIVNFLKGNSSEAVAAIIPIENSIEGIVREAQDNLSDLSKLGYRIFAEIRLPVEHSLIGFGEKLQIKTITSHPQALAQCREYIYNNWGDEITLKPALSTSNAVVSLLNNDISIAAIGNEYCAKLYNIPLLEIGINDKKNNTTRFILVSKKNPKNNNNNKVSLTFSTENKPGALNKVLNIFEKYELNLSYIDSRPSRRELGEYVFYVDFAGHTKDANVTMALIEIQQYVKMFEILSEGAICV